MSATIFNVASNLVKALKPNLSLNDVITFLTGTIDPTAVATSANPGSLFHNTVTGDVYRKIDSGSTTNWQKLASGSNAGVNYVLNPDFESNIANWNVFKESDSVTFTDVGDLVGLTAHGLQNGNEISFTVINSTTGISVDTKYFVVNATTNNFQVASTSGGSPLALTTDGTGTLVRSIPKTGATAGSPGITFTRTTSTPLRGSGSGLMTKDAANRMGEGVNTPLTIALADRYSELSVIFKYDVSANFGAGSDSILGDLTWWVYDVTNSTLQQITPFKMVGGSTGGPHTFSAKFQSSDSLSYRLIGIISQVNTSAWTAKFDDFSVGPILSLISAPVSDWQPYTPVTDGFGTISNVAVFWRRVGDSIDIKCKFTAGTVTGVEARVGLPPGITSSDTAKIPTIRICGMTATSQVNQVQSVLIEPSKTYLTFGRELWSGLGNSPLTKQNVTDFLANGDEFSFFASGIPIAGWASNVLMSNDADTRVCLVRVVKDNSQSVPDNTNTLVNYETVDHDTHGAWNLATDRFTAPSAGFYCVSVSTEFAANAAGQRANQLYIDGSLYCELGAQPVNSGTFTSRVFGTTVVYLRANQYVEIFAYQSSGGALNVCVSGNDYTYLTIVKVQGPALPVSGEAVNAMVYANSIQTTLVDTVFTKINFNTKDYDTHNAFDLINDRYVAPSAGKYEFITQIRLDGGFTVNETETSFYKNGNEYLRTNKYVSGNGDGIIAQAQIKLMAGEYVEVFVKSNSGTNRSTSSTTTKDTNLSVKKID